MQPLSLFLPTTLHYCLEGATFMCEGDESIEHQRSWAGRRRKLPLRQRSPLLTNRILREHPLSTL